MAHNNTWILSSLCLVLMGTLLLTPHLGYADNSTHLEIIALKKRLETLEQSLKKEKEPHTEKPYVKIGGYAKLDMVFSSASAGANSIADEFIVNGLIPTNDNNEKNQLKMTARESRIWVKGGTTDKKTSFYIEGDFFGNKPSSSETLNNNSDFRLRQAYGEFATQHCGQFLFGQAWSTFQNLSAFPHTTTLGTLPGQIFTRVPMIRWSKKINEHSIQLALENPESNLKNSANITIRPDDDRMPDIVLRYNLKSLSISTLLRQLRCDTPLNCNDSQQAWALSIAGRLNPSSNDQVRFQLHWGDGIGRYIAGGVFPGGVINANGDIETVEVQALMLSYQHQWNPQWASALVFNTARADNLHQISNTSEEINTYHINTIWWPTKPIRLGLEYIRAENKTVEGAQGDLDRVIFSSKYHF